jgi:hypothetical protein
MIAYIPMLGCRPKIVSDSAWTPQSELPNGQLGAGSRRAGPCGRPLWKFGSREGAAIRTALTSNLREQSENVYENKGSLSGMEVSRAGADVAFERLRCAEGAEGLVCTACPFGTSQTPHLGVCASLDGVAES